MGNMDACEISNLRAQLLQLLHADDSIFVRVDESKHRSHDVSETEATCSTIDDVGLGVTVAWTAAARTDAREVEEQVAARISFANCRSDQDQV